MQTLHDKEIERERETSISLISFLTFYLSWPLLVLLLLCLLPQPSRLVLFLPEAWDTTDAELCGVETFWWKPAEQFLHLGMQLGSVKMECQAWLVVGRRKRSITLWHQLRLQRDLTVHLQKRGQFATNITGFFFSLVWKRLFACQTSSSSIVWVSAVQSSLVKLHVGERSSWERRRKTANTNWLAFSKLVCLSTLRQLQLRPSHCTSISI